MRLLGRRDHWALFFGNVAGAAVSVNVLRYRNMNYEFSWTELEDMDVDDVYFQQDGATCYASGETIGFLREKFPGRVISRNGDYNSFIKRAVEAI